jgi:type II secretory pathway pseudopilin PulG
MRNTHQRGIAIGPILFVVAILAVLASAIAAGSGSFNSDISAISAKAQASAILEYANEVKFAVDRVLAKGCTDTEISFQPESGPNNYYYDNPFAPSDKSCHVFDSNGGGITVKHPPEGTNKVDDLFIHQYPLGFISYFIGGYAAIPNLGTSNNELVLYLPIKSIDLCESINNILGISSIIGSTLYWCGQCMPSFGSHTPLYTLFSYPDFWPSTMSACVESRSSFPNNVSDAKYFFYRVLIVR